MKRPDYVLLAEILTEMNMEGGYTASILARADGLLVASAKTPSVDQDIVAAMAGYVSATVERMRDELALGNVHDITVRCSEGKAVFKKVPVTGEDLILAALMPRGIRYHARLLGKTATKIARMFGKQ